MLLSNRCYSSHCASSVSSVQRSLLVIQLGLLNLWAEKIEKKEKKNDSKNIIHLKLCDSLTFKWMASLLSLVVWSGRINEEFQNCLPNRNDKCNFKTFIGFVCREQKNDLHDLRRRKFFQTIVSRSPSN